MQKPTLSPETEREFEDLIKELFIGFCECGHHNVYLGDSDKEDILPLKQFIAKVEQRARDEERQKPLYRVIYGNYFPSEVDSIWRTEEEAEKRVEELGGDMWEVEEYDLSSSPPTTNERIYDNRTDD